MPADEEELYQDHILDHYEDPYHRGHCTHCTHAHQDDNPLCGDVISMELQIDDGGKLREVFFDGDGCCISQAAASMIVEKFDGSTIEDVKKFTANDMLELFGVASRPTGRSAACCPGGCCNRPSTRPSRPRAPMRPSPGRSAADEHARSNGAAGSLGLPRRFPHSQPRSPRACR